MLNRWVLGFFRGHAGGTQDALGDDRFEGHRRTARPVLPRTDPRFVRSQQGAEADLRRYDLNVVAHWQAITAQRNKLEGHELQMKYFQYLSLLFTELYLDWYFNHRQDCSMA